MFCPGKHSVPVELLGWNSVLAINCLLSASVDALKCVGLFCASFGVTVAQEVEQDVGSSNPASSQSVIVFLGKSLDTRCLL